MHLLPEALCKQLTINWHRMMPCMPSPLRPCFHVSGFSRAGKKLSSALRVNKPFPWTRKSYGFDARPPAREVLIEQCWIFPRGSPHPHMEISEVTSWRRGISRNVQRVHHVHSIVWEKYRSGACSWYHPVRVLRIYGKAPPVRVTRTGTCAGRPARENPDTWKHGLNWEPSSCSLIRQSPSQCRSGHAVIPQVCADATAIIQWGASPLDTG